MIDIANRLNAIHRQVEQQLPADGSGERVSVLLRRSYGALMGLGLFLRGDAVGDPVAAANSPRAQEFSKQSVHAWAEVVKDSGSATAEQLAAATEVSLAQFAPELATPPQQTSG
jgi:hypothetical protein